MATLDYQLELGFPRNNFKDILAATLPPISVRATKLFEKKIEGNPRLPVRVSTKMQWKSFDGNPRL